MLHQDLIRLACENVEAYNAGRSIGDRTIEFACLVFGNESFYP